MCYTPKLLSVKADNSFNKISRTTVHLRYNLTVFLLKTCEYISMEVSYVEKDGVSFTLPKKSSQHIIFNYPVVEDVIHNNNLFININNNVNK